MHILSSKPSRSRWSPTCYLLLLALATSETAALSQALCSSLNTGSSNQQASSDVMSNGKCHDECSGYAFAIVQYKSCWCSNYAPGDTTSTGSCNVNCPGYPFEQCGDQSAGLYGYIALGPSPQGTQGGAASTPSPSASPSQNSDSNNQQEAVSGQTSPLKGIATSVVAVGASFSGSSGPLGPSMSTQSSLTNAVTSIDAADLTALSQTSQPSPVQVTVQNTVTNTPQVETQVVSVTPSVETSTANRYIPVSITLTPETTSTPTPTSTPQTTPSTTSSAQTTPSTTSSAQTTPSTTSSPSLTWTPTPVVSVMTVTGKVQTLTVTPTAPPEAVQTVIAAKENAGGFFSDSGKVAGTFVAVAAIVLAALAGLAFFFWRRRKRNQQQEALPSTAGSGTPQRRPSRLSQMGLLGGSLREKRQPPTIQTSGWDPGTSAEKSPADTLNRRDSYPRVVDQRLEPTALWNPLHDNGSHVSVRSFRDDQDYSRRMLRVANPDEN